MSKILPPERRSKIHKKACGKCAEVCREVGADFAYMVVVMPGSGGVHIVDGASGDLVPNMGSFLRSLASAHDAQDTDTSAGDAGWRQ